MEQNQPKPALYDEKGHHICPYCNKSIAEGEVAVDHAKYAERRARSTHYYYVDEYYHRDCLEALQKERKEKEEREFKAKVARKKKISIGWGIAAGVIGLAVALVILLAMASNGVMHPAVAVVISIGVSYAMFAAVYCILCGSFIEDVFLTVASWSIHFPGLIFSWDIDGFIWAITMKILFAFLGAIVGFAVLVLALALSAVLAIFAFPFILVRNIRTGYADQLSF